MNLYARESNELQAVTVSVDEVPLGVDDLDDVELMVTTSRERPSATVAGVWMAPVVLGAKYGVMTEGPTRGPGTYLIWYHAISAPEDVVEAAGSFRIT